MILWEIWREFLIRNHRSAKSDAPLILSFGGGFEMLRDGGDKAGLWHVLERFAVLVSDLAPCDAFYLIFIDSVAAVVSHIPWASRILHKIPFISGDLQRLRKVGVDSASSRLKAGASTKDLWYHLVRWLVVCERTLSILLNDNFQSDEAGLEKEPPLVKDVVADGKGIFSRHTHDLTLIYRCTGYPSWH